MMLSSCCKLRTMSFSVGILFLLVQTGFLILSFFMMRDIEGHVLNILNWLSEHGVGLTSVPAASQTPSTVLGPQAQSELPTGGIVFHREYIIRKSADYLAIPITINVVFIISDTLLIWASGARNKILIWPWLVLHFLEFLFFIAALIFVMVILPEPWTKVVVFLICCPIILLLGFFWLVVKCFYNYLRDVHIKAAVAAVYQNGLNPPHNYHGGHHHPHTFQKGHNHPINPPTVYKPNPHNWDQPAPVWALRPNPYTWEPKYAKNRLKSGKRRLDRVMELPDGTMVMPIDDDESDTNSNSNEITNKASPSNENHDQATANFEDNEEEKDSTSYNQGSVRSLSTKFGQRGGQSSKLHDPVATITSSSYAPMSEDRSSIISLSDKYRQQEEVEIFHEQYFAPPPEPIRPGQVSGRRYGGSSRPSSYHSTETFRENFRL